MGKNSISLDKPTHSTPANPACYAALLLVIINQKSEFEDDWGFVCLFSLSGLEIRPRKSFVTKSAIKTSGKFGWKILGRDDAIMKYCVIIERIMKQFSKKNEVIQRACTEQWRPFAVCTFWLIGSSQKRWANFHYFLCSKYCIAGNIGGIIFGSRTQNRYCKNIGGFRFGGSVWDYHTYTCK